MKNSFFIILILTSTIAILTPIKSQPIAYLIPHSHCDVGWLNTVNEYYTQNVSKILSSIVEILTEHNDRKFNWAETLYFKMWIKDPTVSQTLKSQFKFLVEQNQIEFIGGGIVQNDEALPTYSNMIDSMTLGHDYLRLYNKGKDFNINVGWQIDPFGVSKTFSYLTGIMGARYHVINRIDDRLKQKFSFIKNSGSLIDKKEFQFFWRFPSFSGGDPKDLFISILDIFYTTPEYCFVNKTTHKIQCIGYNFEGDPKQNPRVTDKNLHERSWMFSELIKEKEKKYLTKHIIVPFGGDFLFQNANAQFSNMDRIIKEINTNKTYGISVKYSTLSDYFGIITSEKYINLYKIITKTDDYFPLSTCWLSDEAVHYNNCVSYWSGFYGSYPQTMKRMTREVDMWLRAIEIMFVLSYTAHLDYQHDFSLIEKCRTNVAIMQHHDAVTGTSKKAVRKDYSNRLKNSLHEMKNLMPKFLKWYLKNDKVAVEFNISNLKEFNFVPIILYNSLGWIRSEWVHFEYPKIFEKEKIEVVTYVEGKQILIPYLLSNGLMWIFGMEIPAAGYKVFYVQKSKNETIINNEIDCNGDVIEIDNDIFLLSFKKQSDNVYKLDTVLNKKETPIKYYKVNQKLMSYTSYNDGAYVLFTKNTETEMKYTKPKCKFTSGDYYQELRQYFSDDIYQSYVLFYGFNDETVAKYIHFTTNIKTMGTNLEVFTRFNTGLGKSKIHVDSNGFQVIQRNNTVRFNDATFQSNVSGNFYPMTTYSYLKSFNNHFFHIFTKQSLGISSQKVNEGTFDILVSRNTLTDDGRGVNENVFVSNPVSLHLLLSFSKEEIQWGKRSCFFENDLFVLFDKFAYKNFESVQKYQSSVRSIFSPIIGLSENTHLLTLRSINGESGTVLRLYNLDKINNIISYVDIKSLFHESVYIKTPIREYSLTFQRYLRDVGMAALEKNEIQTFEIEVGFRGNEGFNKIVEIVLIFVGGVLLGAIIIVTLSICLMIILFWKRKKEKRKSKFFYERIQYYDVNSGDIKSIE